MTEEDLLTLMAALDCGSSMRGLLTPETRARIFAAVGDPSNATWDDAHSIVIDATEGIVTLWQAVLLHTGYNVTSKPADGAWPAIPTTAQLLDALRAHLLTPTTDD